MISFFNKIIDVLTENSIPYMLSGSVAMSVYVVPRATRDFDFVVFLQKKDIINFAEAFKDGFYCDTDAITDAVKHKGFFNIIDHDSGYKADFVILKNNAFRQAEFARRAIVDFWGKQVSIVTVEDLLISKLIWIQDFQSAIQLEDIRQLLQSEKLDITYIQNWIKTLGLKTFDLL